MHRLITIFGLLTLLGGLTCPAYAGIRVFFDWGIFGASWTDIDGNQRRTVLGPFYEQANGDEGTLSAIRPFWSGAYSTRRDQTVNEFLWPLANSRRDGAAWTWRFGTVMGFYDDVSDPNGRYRLWALPFYFQGRDKNGEDYRALFPIGGTINEFLGRDTNQFFLFPLYGRQVINDVETTNYLWPIFSRTIGDRDDRFRIFPIYGHSRREGMGEKRFVLWPFWTDVRYDWEGSKGQGWILFPLFGHLKLQDQESYWVIPPFFRYAVGEEGNSRLHGPWPFFQKTTGESEKLYIFPLAGEKKIGHVTKSFLLWPFVFRDKLERNEYTLTRNYVMPFLYYFNKVPRNSEEKASTYLKIWPFFSWEDGDRGQRLRMLELWPVRNQGSIERNLAPLWRLAQYQSNGTDSDTEILWGTYRRIKRGDEVYTSIFPLYESQKNLGPPQFKTWSVLKGLIGYERREKSRKVKLLYFINIPWGSSGNVKEAIP